MKRPAHDRRRRELERERELVGLGWEDPLWAREAHRRDAADGAKGVLALGAAVLGIGLFALKGRRR